MKRQLPDAILAWMEKPNLMNFSSKLLIWSMNFNFFINCRIFASFKFFMSKKGMNKKLQENFIKLIFFCSLLFLIGLFIIISVNDQTFR